MKSEGCFLKWSFSVRTGGIFKFVEMQKLVSGHNLFGKHKAAGSNDL